MKNGSIARIKRRWQAATPGPWFLDRGIIVSNRARYVAYAGLSSRNDLRALQKAPSDVAWLIHKAESLEKENAILRARLRNFEVAETLLKEAAKLPSLILGCFRKP